MAKKPAEQPPDPDKWPYPPFKTFVFLLIALLVGATWGLGMNSVNDNIGDMAWSLKGSQLQATYLVPMYLGSYIAGLLFFFKFRSQFGLIIYSRVGVTCYWFLCICHMFIGTVPEALVIRGLTGFFNGFMSPTGVLYAMVVLPASKRMPWGYVFGLALAPPLVVGVKAFSFSLEQSHEFLNGMFTFTVGMATLVLGLVWLSPMPPIPTKKAYDWVDFFSAPLLLCFTLSLSFFLMMGRSYWWFDYHFIGYLLIVTVVSFSLFVIIENARKRPYLKMAYVLDSRLLLFAAMLLGFRLLMSSQSFLFGNVMSANGYGSRQLTEVYFWAFVAESLAMFFVGFMYAGHKSIYFYIVFSLLLFTVGSGLNMFSSPLTGPQQFMVGQIMIGFATGMFYPTIQTIAVTKSNAYGTTGIITYLIFFLTSQLAGGLLDEGLFNTWADFRENFHYQMLNQEMVASRPPVAQALQSYAAAASQITGDVSIQQAAAVDALSEQTKSQASLMANNDMFIVITVIGAFLTTVVSLYLVFVPIFRKKRRRN